MIFITAAVTGFLLLIGEVLFALWFAGHMMGTPEGYWARAHAEEIEAEVALTIVVTLCVYFGIIAHFEDRP